MTQFFYSWVLHIRFLLLLSFSAVLFSCQGQAQNTDISIEEFQSRIGKENVQILDVRTLEEYNSGHIAGAFLADWTKPSVFAERIKSLDKNKPVYTYCLSGGRSRAAAAQLKELGFTKVYNLSGGIVAWSRAAMPLEGVQKTRQMTKEEYTALIPPGQTVLVDIGAVWCPPCRQMEPVVKELVQANGSKFKLVQIDGGVQEALSKELNAGSFPTFIIYKGGKEVWRKEGIVAKEELLKQLL